MEIKKAFGVLTLPVVALLSTSCTRGLDISSSLQFQCEANPGMETAKQSFEMISGQNLYIGGSFFRLTDRGNLNYTGHEIEFTSVLVRGKDKPYIDKIYRVELRSAENRNQTIVEVSCNCVDLK